MTVTWSPRAIERVSEIAQWIAETEARPLAAEQWVDNMFAAVARLEPFPESGRAVPEARHRPDLREVLYGRYRIIYRVEAERVLVLTVRHGRQHTEAEDLET